MKNSLKRILLLSLLLVVIGVLLVACDNNGNTTETQAWSSTEPTQNDVQIVDGNEQLVFYKTGEGTYSVSVGTCVHRTEIVVPANYEGGTVTAIADYGFANMPNLRKITLPETISAIPVGAFSGSANLESVTVGTHDISKDSVYAINGKIFGDVGALQIADYALKGTKIMELSFSDSHDKQAIVDFSADDIQSGITKISITPKLNDVTDMYQKTDINVFSNTVNTQVDFNTYGLFKNIDVVLYKGDTLYAQQTVGNVKVTASHYNFAYLNATYPVLVASLKLNEITENGQVPTFVALARNASYNWDKLPYNMQCLPMLTEKDATEGDFHQRRSATEDYIKELYELNPYSHFSLYVVDNYPELILEFLVANGIPETNWNAVMLSDGSGTAYQLSQTFNVENPSERYNTMKAEWAALKQYFYEKGSFDWVEDCKYIYDVTSAKGSGDRYSVLARYAYVVAKEQDNVSWWVNRLRAEENLSAINEKDETFTQDIINTAVSFYTNNLLAALSPEEEAAFKDLYNFNDEMFSVAEQQGKKVMVILGTSWNGEKDNFYNYMKLTMKYYGDDYVYYYKGHPGYPTSLYQGREDALKQLADEGYTIYELDNAIAAEVILFFYPGIYSSGWATTTFESLEDHTKAGIVFDKDLTMTETYRDLMEVFADDIAANTSSYGNIALDASKRYCLLQYNDTTEYEEKIAAYTKHEIAIYNVTDDEIKYYKSTGENTWKEVTADGNDVA